MKRRFARFLGLSSLGLSLVAGPAWSQDKADQSRVETPRVETPAPAAPPAVEMPPAAAFVPVAAPRPNLAVGVEFLQWWYKRDAIPSLVNTAKETDTQFAGTQNDPNAASLFGSKQNSFNTVPGVRLNVAVAIVENVDVEFSGFLMESRSVDQTFSGTNGQPFLTRPFFNQHDLVEGGFDTSSASGISGSINIHTQNRLYGTEANLAWYPVVQNSNFQKFLFGVRQISLNESITVTENVRSNQGALAPDDKSSFLAFFPTRAVQDPNGVLINSNFNAATQSIRIVDGFVTRNEFIGPQVGAQWRWSRGAFSFDMLSKVAFGVNHESIRVQGNTSLLTGGVVTQTGPGGLLAVANNSGNHTADELTVVPELGLKLNFDMTQRIRFNVGYNLLYMTSAARPGNQIDRRINPQLVPSDIAYYPQTKGPFFPNGFFRDNDFYAHGITFGMEINY